MKKIAVIGQSGGPTSAINATLAGVIAGCFENGFDEIYGMKNGIEGLLEEKLIDLKKYFSSESDPLLELLSDTPSSALGSCRKKIKDDETVESLYTVFEKFGITHFFYIGGNDSMDAVMKLTDYAERHDPAHKVIFTGVPKTIDNDLVFTDHTPGFGSAAKYIASSVTEMVRDCSVYTTKAVTIFEIMGRDAGWLTASSALAKDITGAGVDLIYLPEKPFSEEKFLSDVKEILEKGDKPYCTVAVSEGIRDENGNYTAEAAMSGAVDVFGHKYLAGTGKYLENLVREKIGCKVRSVELNILQRCAGHLTSETDIRESQRVGFESVKIAVYGKSGMMAALVRDEQSDGSYSVHIEPKEVKDIANLIKKMPDDFINADANGVTEKCLEYLRPLIVGERNICYENGLPKHFSF